MHIVEQKATSEKAILIGVNLPGRASGETAENLRELELLAKTAGLAVSATVIQDRQKIHPASYIGSGKLDEVKLLLHSSNAGVVVFDDDLGPAQIRNLERALEVKIIDRSTLILDIFANHARTSEAKTQVELAQLQYLLPRLTRQWSHLSRQVGGIGTRGPGETQLETDRRLVRTRIGKLRQKLEQMDRQRETRSKNRSRFFRAVLVGYTNVGKSTLMNLLTGTDVLVENQLFATLDSTNRRLKLNGKRPLILGDTVGFIRKLPHHLVASFRSTLKVVRDADLLLHVVDVSHPHFREQMHTVMDVLQELDVHRKPMLIVFNKIDLLKELELLNSLKQQYPGSVFVSAVNQMGIDALKRRICRIVEEDFVTASLRVKVQHQKFIHFVHSVAAVEELRYQDSEAVIRFRSSRQVHERIREEFRQLTKTRTAEGEKT